MTRFRKRSLLGPVVNALLAALAFSLLGLVVFQNRDKIGEVFRHRLDLRLLALGLLIYQIGLLISYMRWYMLVRVIEKGSSSGHDATGLYRICLRSGDPWSGRGRFHQGGLSGSNADQEDASRSLYAYRPHRRATGPVQPRGRSRGSGLGHGIARPPQTDTGGLGSSGTERALAGRRFQQRAEFVSSRGRRGRGKGDSA